jgi:hypothetical protein
MHFDQNIILIVAAAIYGISRLVARIAKDTREQSQRRKQQPPEQQTDQPPQPTRPVIFRPRTDEERVREFLEALGQPAGSTPPPKIQPRTDIPPRPLAPVSPPPLSRPFSPVILGPLAEKARKIFAPPPPPTAAQTALSEVAEPGAWLSEEEKTAAAKFEAATRKQDESAEPLRAEIGIDWKSALRSRESVRTALVLREILGPPRGLMEFAAN